MRTPYTLGENAAGYRQMHNQVAAAGALLNGESDLALFTPIPADPNRPTEPDGMAPGFRDVAYAVGAALYAEVYGPASERLQPRESVMEAALSWNGSIANAYRKRLSPGRFDRAFFRGGLWQVCIGLVDTDGELQERITAGQKPEKMREMRALAARLHSTLTHGALTHNDPGDALLSHESSHFDALHLGNSVLHDLEQNGTSDPEAMDAALARSLPDLLHLAHFEIEGVNFATDVLLPTSDNQRIKDKFLVRREDGLHLNMQAIGEAVLAQIPDVGSRRHRGCPVVYANTTYQGKPQRIFAVMFQTLRRIYRETGALSDPGKRRLQPKITLLQKIAIDTQLAQQRGRRPGSGTVLTFPSEPRR